MRFVVSGIDAPAARLRVFDRSRQLLGTAGLLRTGDNLYGELWMQLEGATRAVSELEAPGLRGPFRTTHRLAPGRRWTIHLMTVADPDSIAGTLSGLRTVHRAVQTALYRDSAVTLNPIRSSGHSTKEHIPFLRMAERALTVERDFAIPVGAAAYLPPGTHLPNTGALALAGAGVSVLLREQVDGEPYRWWKVPGGSRILVVSVPQGSTPAALGFDLNQNDMTGRVEEWLKSTALRFSPDDDSGTAVVLNSNADDALPATLAAVSTWNSRFAYPRVVVGNHQVLFDDIEERTTSTSVSEPVSIQPPQSALEIDRGRMKNARTNHARQRTENLGKVLANAVGQELTELDAVAPFVSTAVAGTIVLNPSPYQHSDLVRMSDGSERLATNVPGLGYAFFPDQAITGDTNAWESVVSTYSAAGEQLRVTVDRTSGAISSLVQLNEGKEWVRPDSEGLNAVRDARLLRVSTQRLAGVATRLVISRRAPSIGAFTSTITLYDELPRICLSNESDPAGQRETSYHFHFAVEEPEVVWEVPAGRDTAPLPISILEHIRWVSLAGSDGTMMFRGYDAPLVSVDVDATLTSLAPRGISRYRLAPLPRYSSQDMPWIFGWDSEPMAIARVEPNGRNVMPRYGALFTIEQVGVAVLGVQPASDGYGAIAYVQETLGVSRTVSVGPGVLSFRNAETVDFLERYLEQQSLRADGSIQLHLPAHSVVAIRLSGLEVSGAR